LEVPRPTLEVLERTRRGEVIDPADITALVGAWTTGAASDAQMAAWCATAGIRGASYEVAKALAEGLLAGGDRLELASLGPTTDIRSTGGVGDSALIFAASAVAASLGVIVASTGARGLSFTGGILDALEAIPGMRVDVTLEEYVLQARNFGIVIAEPGDRLVPGERRLADLRESTATAEGDTLVAVSAAVRAVSGGSTTVVVEAPGGSGGLLADTQHAAAAADLITRLGADWHRRVHAEATLRAVPLAGAAGPGLEIVAGASVLLGEGDPHLVDRVAALAGRAAEESGVLDTGGADAARAAIADGRALATAERWVEAQGGDPAALSEPDLILTCLLKRELVASHAGSVDHVDAAGIGTAVRWLGGGRLDPDQVLDHAVGVQMLVGPGESVEVGQTLAIVHASDDWLAGRAEELLGDAWVITGA